MFKVHIYPRKNVEVFASFNFCFLLKNKYKTKHITELKEKQIRDEKERKKIKNVHVNVLLRKYE